jgi:transcriptional regulator with XRE-family HTH domain
MNLNEKIQKLRKDQGLSQEQLAEQLHVTRQAVSKWETGEGLPDIENILQLSELFGVSVDYLLKNQPTAQGETNEDLALAEALEQAPDTKVRGHFTFDGAEGIKGAIFPLAILVYLVMGFYFDLWHPGWMIFVLAALLSGFFSYIKAGRFNMSIYTLATVAFLAIGFITGQWVWLIFVGAWVLNCIMGSFRKKNTGA